MFCRNTSITRNTSAMASNSVLTTSSIEICTNLEVSYGILYSTPAGKYLESSSSLALTALAVPSALPVGESCTPMAEIGWPLIRAEVA